MSEVFAGVVLLRLIFPLLILKKPFLGGLLSLYIDLIDWHIFSYFNPADLASYQQFDKLLDLYYLSLEAYVVLGWDILRIKRTMLILYAIRFVGVAWFAVAGIREYLFLFPNAFEYFFLAVLGYRQFFKKDLILPGKKLFIFIFVLLIIKFFQEYIVHLSGLPYWKLLNWWEWL